MGCTASRPPRSRQGDLAQRYATLLAMNERLHSKITLIERRLENISPEPVQQRQMLRHKSKMLRSMSARLGAELADIKRETSEEATEAKQQSSTEQTESRQYTAPTASKLHEVPLS